MTEIKKSPYTILFVDDEEKARKYFAKGLEKDFNILTAESVAEAKKIIEEKHSEIAVVISDQRMPGGNGVKLLQHLREEYPQIIRLLTTAYSDLTDAIDCVNKGEILRYIQKPWDYDMLKHELTQSIELFEIKKERNELLYEKMMVKKRMNKVSRAKYLILFAKTLAQIRFSGLAAENFIKEFATVQNSDEKQAKEENWTNFELGNEDLLETLFLLEVIEKVSEKIPLNQNYQFETILNSNQIFDIIKETSSLVNVALINNSKTEINTITINDFGFKNAIKELFAHISLASCEAEISIDDLDDKILLKLIVSGNKDYNLFLAKPSNKDQAELYVNLLTSYFLIHHHGGSMMKRVGGGKIEYSIYLPKNPLSVIDDKKISAEDLDDMLLAVVLGDV